MLNFIMSDGIIMMNISLNLKNKKAKEPNQIDSGKNGYHESDIIIGKTNLNTNMKKYDSLNPLTITNFIRKNALYSNTNITYVTVNTKKEPNTDFYTTYYLPLPNLHKENKIVDYIYGLLIDTIRLSYPNSIKTKEISFQELNINKLFTKEEFTKAQMIKSKHQDQDQFKDDIITNGMASQLEIIDFFNSLEYHVDSKKVIMKDDFDNVTNFFNQNTKIKRKLNKYEEISYENYATYFSLATFNKIVYDKPLNWHNLSSEIEKKLLKKAS